MILDFTLFIIKMFFEPHTLFLVRAALRHDTATTKLLPLAKLIVDVVCVACMHCDYTFERVEQDNWLDHKSSAPGSALVWSCISIDAIGGRLVHFHHSAVVVVVGHRCNGWTIQRRRWVLSRSSPINVVLVITVMIAFVRAFYDALRLDILCTCGIDIVTADVHAEVDGVVFRQQSSSPAPLDSRSCTFRTLAALVSVSMIVSPCSSIVVMQPFSFSFSLKSREWTDGGGRVR